MDALVEIILELVIEVFGELIFVGIGKLFTHVGESKKALKRTKIIIYSIIASLLLVLLVFSLIYKKGVIVWLVLSYLIFLLIAYYLMFIFNTVLARPRCSTVIRWIVRALRYVFMISLIIAANLTIQDHDARILLIFGSSIGIIVYIFIDAFRIYQYDRRNSYKKLQN